MINIKEMMLVLKKFIKFKLMRFLIIGSLNTLISIMNFSLLFYIGFHFWIAGAINLVMGIYISLYSHSKVTFKGHKSKPETFILTQLLFYTISSILLFYADKYSINIYLANISITLPLSILNFFIMKKYAFEMKGKY